MDDGDRPTPILSPSEIERLMSVATPREREVLATRFGLDLDEGRYRTTTEVARVLGERQEVVREAELEAMGRFNEIERDKAQAPGAASPTSAWRPVARDASVPETPA